MDLKNYPELQRCIEGAQMASVVHAIRIGNALTSVKAQLEHGEWIPFLKGNFGYSIRSCQNFMYIAKHPIAKKYYKLGTEEIIKRLRAGDDLSF